MIGKMPLIDTGNGEASVREQREKERDSSISILSDHRFLMCGV